jgi:hypothetical protein
MKRLWSCAALGALCLAAPGWPVARAGEAPTKTIAPAPARTYQVPFRITAAKHILVRAKINGKGPFNFILDTGAPGLFIATEVGKKLGLKTDSHGVAALDRLEIEGGVVVPKASGVVETPFQLEGMNGLGLAGVELHGILGYGILARYRMEIDLTRDKMAWTELAYDPKQPRRLGGGGRGMGGLDLIGDVLKSLGSLMGTQAAPDVRLRGFLGVELKDGPDTPVVQSVLARGPAGRAGLQAGDQLLKFQGRTVVDTDDVLRFARKLAPGDSVMLMVRRAGKVQEIKFTAGEGL